MTRKPGYQNKHIRRDLALSTKKIVKKGYGSYFVWIGWCEKCKKLRAHTEPQGMSYYNPTCSEGHYSEGKIQAKKLLNKLKKP